MTQIPLLATLISLIITFSSCGQKSIDTSEHLYLIDPSIKPKIDSKVISSDKIIFTSIDIKMFENDSITWDTYATGKSIDQCFTTASIDNNTISIVSFFGLTAGFGYQIQLSKDTCIVIYFAKTDAEIYKLKKSDPLAFGVTVPCRNYKLTLVNKPTFKNGESIEGIVELTSEEYYEVDNGNEKKYKMQLTGYFKTERLESKESI